MKYNLQLGFPETWATSPLEYEYANYFYRGYFGNEENGMLVNLTWKDHRKQEILDIIKYQNINCVLFFNFVDEYDTSWNDVIDYAKKKMGSKAQIVGHSPYDGFQFQFWAQAVGRLFTEYEEQDILPFKIRHTYLCYNRKPHKHRVDLYNSFKENSLLDNGIFTLGTDENNSIFESVSDNGFSGNPDAFKILVDDTGIPNDLLSLGTLDYWRKSFLVIVSETIPPDSDEKFPFLTEKTFKPIVGMRPFIVLGPASTVSWLRKNGFVTFNEDFGCSDSPSIDEITVAVKELQDKNLGLLYKKLYDKMAHNKKNLENLWKQTEKDIKTIDRT